MQSLQTLPLRSKRDVVVARQRARQIAALLGFDLQEQACIAAGTFTVASAAVRQGPSSQLCIAIEDKALRVFSRGRPCSDSVVPASSHGATILIKRLPVATGELAAEDVSWVIEQLDQQKYFNLFEEMEHQNQEMLALLHALHVAQGQLGQAPAKSSTSSAA